MKQQLRAVGMAAGLVGTAILAVVIIKLVFTYSSPDIIMYTAGTAMVGIILYTLYGVCLEQIKYKDKIKEIAKK
jgi:uncharacterized membrane protein